MGLPRGKQTSSDGGSSTPRNPAKSRAPGHELHEDFNRRPLSNISHSNKQDNMPVSGPSLPPHLLAKRKRDGDEDDNSSSSSEDDTGPKPPVSEDATKKRRVMGPAPPPAPLDERPPGSVSEKDDSSSDEDDYGPAPLKPGDQTSGPQTSVFDEQDHASPQEEEKSKRDDWMMMPPTQDGLAARMDPTKLRARGFNTSKGPRGAKGDGGSNAAWFETPEQKVKRLQDEAMGVQPSASAAAPDDDFKARAKKAQDADKARRIRQHNDEHRSESLYARHKGSSNKDEDDDPSKRAFDYDKDMSAAPRVTGAQKRDLMNKASGFGSRFSKGNYL